MEVFDAMQLERHPANPVLLPDPASDWECYNVFNPGVICHNGLFHMFYRAQGLDWVSRIGYAVSEDGVHWNRLRRPVLEPSDGSDSRGVEDPRLVEIGGMFYMTYTAFGRESFGPKPTYLGGGITPMIARSRNLMVWERLGSIVRGEDNKDHVLFPRRINGCYAALHRRRPRVWLAYSDDLLTWREEDMTPVFGPRPGKGWDCRCVGGNGVPIETDRGWLMLYHGYDDDHVYRFGVCLLDLKDPSQVINRPLAPIFWPQELWELRGDVPNVVFSNANPVVGGTVHVYYGGGDHVIGLATCRLDQLLDFALNAE
jgi:predicted GH43/DUF377 family glycosyl hydrolase